MGACHRFAGEADELKIYQVHGNEWISLGDFRNTGAERSPDVWSRLIDPAVPRYRIASHDGAWPLPIPQAR